MTTTNATNVKVRKANAADASGIAHVYVKSWQSTYPDILPEQTLSDLSETNETLAWWRSLCRIEPHDSTFVAQGPDGKVVGFASAGPQRRGAHRRRAELYTLYLLDTHHRQGLGSGLISACAQALMDRGAESMVVWVLAKNPARKFYESLGGVPYG
ncbi:MAG: GNAT family N-acetyltransferase, partial [Alphaproteobacteria bacterium]|nr:GNAT family N-acetyltransferase [Alphaproteobacteria bacterium]